MFAFDHEKLDVYRTSIELVTHITEIINQLPKGNAHISDQLYRAGTSISLNIAEGAGEFAKNEKIRFYRIAKRSATECAAIIEICHRSRLIDDNTQTKSRELLIRIISMLTKMARQ